jgi:Fungal specific transcription factor domain
VAEERDLFGANSSAMNFAKNVYGKDADCNPRYAAAIPSESGASPGEVRSWALQRMQMPMSTVMEMLLDSYFQRSHWYILIFHEPSLRKQALDTLQKPTWRTEDRGVVMAALMAAAVGLQTACHDSSWTGHAVLTAHGLSFETLLKHMIAEVRANLMDLLDDCRIETVQVCILLGTFYIYHGSPNLAWSVLGMATRAGYALGLHSDQTQSSDQISEEVRRRCWNHLKVADTFASMIYGRPTSLDSAFAAVQDLSEIDDSRTISTVRSELDGQETLISTLTYHRLKYRLYDILAEVISRFRLLHLRRTSSSDDWNTLFRTINEMQNRLSAWDRDVPDLLRADRSTVANMDDPARNHQHDPGIRRTLHLQAIALQAVYDSTLIFIQRPVLECGISALRSSGNAFDLHEPLSTSLRVSVAAALRISAISIQPLKHEMFISFILMHFFTAGVILCIPPSIKPFSDVGQDCKRGVIRIIKASKSLKDRSQIAELTEKLLSDLFRVTLQREIDAALQSETLQNGQSPNTNDVTASMANSNRGGSFDAAQYLTDNLVPDQGDASTGSQNNGNVQESQLDPDLMPNNHEIDLDPANAQFPDMDSSFHSLYFNDIHDYGFGETMPNDHFQSAFGAFGQGNTIAFPLEIFSFSKADFS